MISYKQIIFTYAIVFVVNASSTNPSEVKDDFQLTPKKSPLDLIVGTRKPNDFLVHYDYFFREPSEKRLIAFRPFDIPYEYTITQVRALDQTNGTGGIVTYEYGGPGMNRVLLGFHGRVFQGTEYAIELYGEPYVS